MLAVMHSHRGSKDQVKHRDQQYVWEAGEQWGEPAFLADSG